MKRKVRAPGRSMLIHNAREVIVYEEGRVRPIEKGAVLVESGRIAWVGRGKDVPAKPRRHLDAQGGIVIPGFVDCHTHLVFAGTREQEFARRLAGVTYKEILEAGGGILNTVDATRGASAAELLRLARVRIRRMIEWGTTTFEVKSGYGLSLGDELKMLRVIDQLRRTEPATVVPTFLGAHAVPRESDKASYKKLLIEQLIPEVARRRLARFCDVFCENFVFNYDDSKEILSCAKMNGLVPKLHADEIEPSRGAELAGEIGAISAEHLIYPSDRGLELMAGAGTVAVLLPGTSLFLHLKDKPPVDKMRTAGLTLALGSDFNPGSCMVYAMPMVLSLGCLVYGLTPDEVLIASTLGAAKAIGLEKEVGSIEPGKWADLLVCALPNYRSLAYEFGRNPVRVVVKRGRPVLSKVEIRPPQHE